MAFWGIEVKPGKPVTHSPEKTRGRLRISQATLGIGDAIKKTILQCNVGKRSPVLLCVLLPEKTESLHLDLEFEEADDVLFSVIGPRSIYLTGYYVRQSYQSNHPSDSESFGVDIQNSHSDGSSYHSDDDEYEDSFIDDDDELQVRSPSPVSSSKEIDETTPENNKLKKRLKKKYQVVDSDSDANSREIEDGDGYLLSVFKSKKAAKTSLTGVGENIAQEKSEKKVDPVDINGKPEGEKLKKKRKKSSKEEKTREVEIDKDRNILREDTWHQVVTPIDLPGSGSGNSKKSKKRRKELQLADENMKDLPAENGDLEQQIDNNLSTNSELLANGSQSETKSKKKKIKKKTQNNGESNMGLPNMSDSPENKVTRSEGQDSNVKPKRTLSNGLIIEEVVNGPPDGKVAAQGKMVKIYYTGLLKENGHIFDSNVGKPPCKFRLGDAGIIEGWNLGIDGMHVGDKRRLTIPPSIGFGNRQVEENVPPNSWLVYDVELVSVRK